MNLYDLCISSVKSVFSYYFCNIIYPSVSKCLKLCRNQPHLIIAVFYVSFFNFLKLAQISKGHICPVTTHYIYIYIYRYRVSQEECARLRESVPYVKLYQYNPKHLCPKLNGYGDNGQRKVWALLVSTYCTPSVMSYLSNAPARQLDMVMQ